MKGLLILIVYTAIMLITTVILTKKERNIERFCVGNRNLKTIISALSIAVTWIWAPALFVSAEKAYTNGLVGLFWFLVPNVLCLILFIPFAKKIREEMPRGITLSGYMKEKYNSNTVKNVYLFQLGALSMLSTGVQLLACYRYVFIGMMKSFILVGLQGFAYYHFISCFINLFLNWCQFWCKMFLKSWFV